MTGGPLVGTRIIEFPSEAGAYAGKILAELGAEVILVEPPGGHPTRQLPPYAPEVPVPESSLWWWYYNAAKESVVLDWQGADRDRLRELIDSAHVVLECEEPGFFARAGLDIDVIRAENPGLIWSSIIPEGDPRKGSDHPFVDLTLLAAGGAVWSCGYDDHTLPPVRGGGNQAYHTASVWAVIGVLVALIDRDESADGQRVVTSMNAACNITTEMATVYWLAAGRNVARQTARHAQVVQTITRTARCADGRYANVGVPPRTGAEVRLLLAWLRESGLYDEFPDAAVLELGTDMSEISLGGDTNPLVTEVYRAGAEAQTFLAERLPAYEFFTEAGRRELSGGVLYWPHELLNDPHFVERGFPVQVQYPLGRTVVQPGAPYRFSASPWSTRAAPTLGQNTAIVLGQDTQGRP
jgi:crotonobetainyl-CoA:carnitine CoA-transferase CaiB-like acyl-CoA transferase